MTEQYEYGYRIRHIYDLLSVSSLLGFPQVRISGYAIMIFRRRMDNLEEEWKFMGYVTNLWTPVSTQLNTPLVGLNVHEDRAALVSNIELTYYLANALPGYEGITWLSPDEKNVQVV